MKKVKKFGDKKLTIRFSEKADIKKAARFKRYTDELAEDDTAYISRKQKISLKEKRKYIKDRLERIKKYKLVILIAEDKDKVVGMTIISLRSYVQSHIGGLGIHILKDYRGIGLGKYFMKEILKLAKTKLKPKPRMIRLSVFSVNKTAISLYKKIGFRSVAKIPKQFKLKGKLYDEVVMLKYL
ncbi:MAG: N-acetyltransferase family protein [Candidatus Nealsonbacteria bacterium]